QLIVLSGANPSGRLPMGKMVQRRGDLLSEAVERRIADRPDVIRALNWPDAELSRPAYWSEDRLHMNSHGHHRVAARVLDALGYEPPAEWWTPASQPVAGPSGYAYYRQYVGPWVRRRVTRTSSGDGRTAKFATWAERTPQ